MNKTNVWNILLLARDLKRNGHEEQQANYLLFSVKKDIPTEKPLALKKGAAVTLFCLPIPDNGGNAVCVQKFANLS